MIDPRTIPTVDVREARRRLEAPEPLLVDVREVREFVARRAPGAVHLPLSGFLQRYEELPRDRELLVICRSGQRSMQATAFLLANGWPAVHNVSGGMLAWEWAGFPVRDGPLEPGEGGLAAE